MNKQCVNCPGATDHTTAECPVMVEASAPIDPIHSAMMLGMTPEPCEPIIEITRQAVTKLLDVVEFGDELERVEKDRLVAFVKELLAEPQPELWAMHSIGPNEVHPMVSKEEAERQAASLIALCKERFPDIPITVNVIPSPYSPFEHFEILAEELTEQVANLRKALDKKKAESPAPAVVNQRFTPAAIDVLLERKRQVDKDGWTPEHDDEHGNGEMAAAAGFYALHAHDNDQSKRFGAPSRWPWDFKWWKPGTARRMLVKAGALILAEIERLDRAEQAKQQEQQP